MCTLTWLLNDYGYDIFFNRDEQRTREKSEAPRIFKQYSAIMPIDPQGKGTWIASNFYGMSLCLLNNYQKQTPATNGKTFTSRGQLIIKLIQLHDKDNVLAALKRINLEEYQPFFLCIFPNNLNIKNDSVYIYQWDGERLTQEPAKQPFISSAILLDPVQSSRQQVFNDIVHHSNDIDNHLAYHASHLPEKSAFSTCMHRDDARTQSFCHISVNDHIAFNYHDGPPCQNNAWINIKIPRS